MKKSMKKIMMFMVCLVALCFCKSVKANAQVMISSGYYHTAMIKNDGSLVDVRSESEWPIGRWDKDYKVEASKNNDRC